MAGPNDNLSKLAQRRSISLELEAPGSNPDVGSLSIQWLYRVLLRLGYPYVYVHQGDHEHLISFVEARLLSADDGQKLSSYPFERSSGMIHSKMCMVCNTFIAKWITEKNDRVSRLKQDFVW